MRTTINIKDDLMEALTALSRGHEIFTIDPHFEKVDGLRLHSVP